ncbi:UDP-N-acetyl-D-glucosamine dehydrogenase [Desulfuribacillus stibiiarsenatis]|uniref:UDP-N-acetyl-D-glucosamine dehydrogenase n=1 Tax=Desulfuribacillus stibiiarsenatis TaxID=1390249 RepID=A0A1E5L9B4_9FIRM|nr:nucleotide sugar dehydrogenase [Desulfuribacillus stibiiarsenatis]OEH86533.1 UDP-N-acetyl-D-glucosamine dehydrogenase [Desulfuribacillus stibiiarsenatis]
MKHELKEKIENRKALISVVGVGYVGLPLAIELAKVGFHVTGVDTNKERVEKLNNGINYISDVNEIELNHLVKQGKLAAVENFSKIGTMDVIIICVPTSLTKNLVPDLQHVIGATKAIAKELRKGQLICIESTIYPGMTDEVVLPILESSGLKVENDFFLCHSPERIDPGNKIYTTENTNKIVGGIANDSLEVGVAFYSQLINHIVPVSSVKVAEFAKIYENTFRSVNIALANEFALLCDKMGISVWDVLDAAFTKPFGIMSFYPGPGVGGHCIPVDPHYLEWKAREYNYITKLIGIAGEINRHMPEFVSQIVLRTLNSLGVSPSKSKVLIVGITYKKDVNDFRESPIINLIELLLKEGVEISYYDPYVSQIIVSSKKLQSIPLEDEYVKSANIVLIATDHSSIDYQWLVETAERIIDTRNATRGLSGSDKKVTLI